MKKSVVLGNQKRGFLELQITALKNTIGSEIFTSAPHFSCVFHLIKNKMK